MKSVPWLPSKLMSNEVARKEAENSICVTEDFRIAIEDGPEGSSAGWEFYALC